eukprot:9495885-Pyramimonas_sp.AAC.1
MKRGADGSGPIPKLAEATPVKAMVSTLPCDSNSRRTSHLPFREEAGAMKTGRSAPKHAPPLQTLLGPQQASGRGPSLQSSKRLRNDGWTDASLP